MAAKTPATTGEGDLIGPNKIRCGALASTEVYSTAGRFLFTKSSPPGNNSSSDVDASSGRLADGTTPIHTSKLGWIYRYFSDIDDADTWTPGYIGIYLALWQPDDVDDDFVSCYVKNGTGELKKGIIEFQTAAAASNLSGYVWLLVDRELNPNLDYVEFE